MRWLALGILVLTVAGCDAMRDAFSTRATVAARAAGQTLTSERLAQIAALGKRIPLETGPITALAGVWADYALFAVAMARNEALDDSAIVLDASWPQVAQLKWEGFRDRLVAQRATLSDAQVDSAYETGSARLLQHVLLRVPSNAAPTVEQEKRRLIDDLRRRSVARNGANFAELAARYSEDPGSRQQGGRLAVAERGSFVGPFEDAGWQLAPGGISGVVRSPYGLHVIRRPPLAEVRDSFRAGLELRMEFRFDSTYLDSLSKRRHLEVKRNAPALAREAVTNFELARGDDRTLVSYRGGRFRVQHLVRWLYALDPQLARSLGSATDQQLGQFLQVLAQRQIVIDQADSAGVTIPAEAWRQLRAEHDSALRVLERLVQLTPRALQDSAPGEGGRVQLAMNRVYDYLERAVQGQTQFVPLPPFLGEALRARHPADLSAAGIAAGLERARALRGVADSLAPPAGGPPGMIPAPGPAPV
ncbi:MAG: peptidylprolyl isomerase, partial [Gemmatimonadales bacterium]